jgi:hypothetical protein
MALASERNSDDLTYRAVERQLNALNSPLYQIGIYMRDTQSMINKPNLNCNQILDQISLLKYKNYIGCDIYVKPDKNTNRAVILLDDINLDTISLMKSTGINPACIIETSPLNFQVWVSLGNEPMLPEQRKILARLFSDIFNGDKASADAYHYGRLAGFTNRKQQYSSERGYPFVLCRNCKGGHAEKYQVLRKILDKDYKVKDKIYSLLKNIILDNSKNNLSLSPDLFFEFSWNQWKIYTGSSDYSKGDFAVTCKMLTLGYSENEIIQALITKSPNINERKKFHILDYALRTVNAASKCLGVKKK